MQLFRSLTGRHPAPSLSDAQRQMYASEATENFRLITSIFSKPAPAPLTASDVVSDDLEADLAEIGEFTELAHGSLDPKFIWDHLAALSQPSFPLDGYESLAGSSLVSTFCGSVAGVKGFAAYRPSKKQLFVAFSGTSTPRQALMNARALLVRYPDAEGGAVHDGFFRMYNGLRAVALAALVKGMTTLDVQELVFTGHSLGGVMSYLFALDVLKGLGEQEAPALASVPVKVVAFGSPRVGNEALARHWRGVVDARNERGCRAEVFSVKNYNDGKPFCGPELAFCGVYLTWGVRDRCDDGASEPIGLPPFLRAASVLLPGPALPDSCRAC